MKTEESQVQLNLFAGSFLSEMFMNVSKAMIIQGMYNEWK